MTGQSEAPMDRRAVIDALNRLAFVAELLDDQRLDDQRLSEQRLSDQGVDAKAVSSLAWSLRSAPGDLTLEQVAAMDGVSVPVFALIDDANAGREPPLLEELEARIPRGLLEVRKLKGLGPKKIRALWQELDVTSLGELEYACQENRLVDLKGFGDKTQASVLEQIERLRAQAGLVRLDQALAIGNAVVGLLEKGGARAFIVGEARRRTEVVRALRIVTTASAEDASTAVGATAVALGVEAASFGVDLAVVSGLRADLVGARLVLETGSAAHVRLLEERARDRGLVLAEISSGEPAGRTAEELEEAVYDALGLVWLEPERREEGVPLVEKGRARPRLVKLTDIVGALHNHTTASDGTASMREMRDAAARMGLRYLAITDHSQSAVYAKGLGASSLEAQRVEAAALNAEAGSDGAGRCVLLAGVESDILKDGSLDYPADVLRGLDVVVASVHSRFGQRGADLTARMVAAARNPFSDIVGHPTGRLLLGRAPAEYDVSALLETCADTGCAVELNANPARLDLHEGHLAEARARKVLVSIAADAHSTAALAHLEYGVAIARRAGLGPEDVLNTRSLEEVRAFLAARRARAREAAAPTRERTPAGAEA